MTNDLLIQAYGAMKHNRRRTALTMLGMAWGVATVALLLAYGAGFGNAIITIFSGFGMKVMGVFPGRTSMQAGGNKAGGQIRFTLDDVDRLVANVPLITHISAQARKEAVVAYDSRTFKYDVQGNYTTIQKIRVLEPDEGRWYNEEDMAQKARVVVLGSEAKEKLFSGKYAIGELVRIDGLSFEVIGVAKAKMQEGDSDINRTLYVPFTAMGDLTDIHYLDGMWLDYESDQYEEIERSVRNTMAQHFKFNPTDKRAVNVFSAMKQVTQFQIISTGLQILLAFIGSLTLGIGGVGLMNIMLVSVTQRTREIGIEKALGARSRDILKQFLAEALTITFVGGVIGIVLAYAVSFAAGTLTFYSAI